MCFFEALKCGTQVVFLYWFKRLARMSPAFWVSIAVTYLFVIGVCPFYFIVSHCIVRYILCASIPGLTQCWGIYELPFMGISLACSASWGVETWQESQQSSAAGSSFCSQFNREHSDYASVAQWAGPVPEAQAVEALAYSAESCTPGAGMM